MNSLIFVEIQFVFLVYRLRSTSLLVVYFYKKIMLCKQTKIPISIASVAKKDNSV